MSRAAGRRAVLLGAASLLFAAPTIAQEGPAPVAPPAADPSPAGPQPAPARRPRRRRTARRPQPPPEAPPAAEATGPRLDAAPVPNRTVEGPRRAAPADNPSFGPSIIHRPLPNTSAAREGARNYDEERLFFPAPGARLTVPFSY